jgi:hypothetical protein
LLESIALEEDASERESQRRCANDQGRTGTVLGAIVMLTIDTEHGRETPEMTPAQYEARRQAHAESVAIALHAKDGSPDKAKRLVAVIAAMFRVRTDLIMGRRRTASVVLARQVAMWFERKHYHRSLQEIGDLFGRDHSTVAYAVGLVEEGLTPRPVLCTKL